MGQHDSRIDDYIARAAPFAQPLLARLRKQVHATCPDVEESVKWGMPAFLYRGRILCTMAAFKQHMAFGFWQGEQVMGKRADPEAMGQFGRIESADDLPDAATLAGYLRKAAALIDEGATRARKPAAPRPELPPPDDFIAALQATPAARATFDAFPPSQRREYVEWIVEAKREDTRTRRIAQAIEWLAEGKPRHWKYMK